MDSSGGAWALHATAAIDSPGGAQAPHTTAGAASVEQLWRARLNSDHPASVYVVLTRSATVLSSIIHHVKGHTYTHAGLALDPRLHWMFSFGRRYARNPFLGCFRRESLDEGVFGRARELPGRIIELTVTATQHAAITAQLLDFLLAHHRYGFNVAGLAGQLVGASIQRGNQFFCSQFVYHVLSSSHVIDWGVPAASVRPHDLGQVDGRTIFEGDLKAYARSWAPAH